MLPAITMIPADVPRGFFFGYRNGIGLRLKPQTANYRPLKQHGTAGAKPFASIATDSTRSDAMDFRYERHNGRLLPAICCLFLSWPLWAGAVESPVDRPTIGLVLSGGGARGAAHVGVIRALEDMRVPIDAVAGTSMGAVVGGLYAAGLSGEEIQDILGSLKWRDLFRDRAPRRDLVYRRKQDDRNYLVRTALGVREGEGIVLPLGLVQGQKITQVLRTATLRVADVQDFDKLPTPFRALATDLETGDPAVLRSGDLATVLRASMSAPGVLAPVEIGGRLLVDGGLVDNLPVRLAREMGVDIAIVVDVSFPLSRRDGLATPLDVTNQMLGIMVRRGTLESRALLKDTDIVIEPDLGRMTAMDFTRVPSVMEEGRTAVVRKQAQLAALSLDEQRYAQYVAARALPPQPDIDVAFVRAGPHSGVDARRIDAVFGGFAGKALEPAKVQEKLDRQYGLDRFASVDYRVVTDDGEDGLEINLRRKSWGPNFLRLGLSLQTDYSGGATGNAAARLLLTGLNTYDAEWLTDLQLGEEPRFYTEFFQPLSLTSDFFVAPSFRYEMKTLQIVEDGERVARYRVRDTEAALAVGAELSNWGEARIGYRYGNGSTRVMIGDPGLPEGDFDIGGAYLQFGYDRLDSMYFPKHGQAFRVRWLMDRESLGASRDADIVEASWQFARSRLRNSFVFTLDAGSALDNRVNSAQDLFTLGGFLELSGLPQDSFIGTQYGLARTLFYRRISRGGSGVFEFPAYLGFSLEAGNTWERSEDVDLSDLTFAGSLFVGAESPVGPVYMALGHADGGYTAFYLLVGRTF
jgi:NTE family protein